MVEQQRLARAEIAVRQALHHVAIRKRIESLSSRLLDTDKLIVARVGVERLRDKAGGRDERGRRRRVPVHMKLVHLEPARREAEVRILDLHHVLRCIPLAATSYPRGPPPAYGYGWFGTDCGEPAQRRSRTSGRGFR